MGVSWLCSLILVQLICMHLFMGKSVMTRQRVVPPAPQSQQVLVNTFCRCPLTRCASSSFLTTERSGHLRSVSFSFFRSFKKIWSVFVMSRHCQRTKLLFICNLWVAGDQNRNRHARKRVNTSPSVTCCGKNCSACLAQRAKNKGDRSGS